MWGRMCEERLGVEGPQECYYCPERIYCSERCQARDWPEHKKICNMGKGETGTEIREAQVLKGTQQEHEKEQPRPGVVNCYKVQGSCIACHAEGELRCARCADVYCSASCHKKDWELHKKGCQPPLPKEKTGKDVQAEQGEVKVKMCSVGEEAKTLNDEFEQWYLRSIQEEVSETEQMEIEMHLLEREKEAELAEQEEIRVLKAKAKKGEGTISAEMRGHPRLVNYCRTIGMCEFCNKEAESRCDRCGTVCCSTECYSENWERHEKDCKSPKEPLEKPGIYYIEGKP